MTGFFSEDLLDDIRGANPIEDVVSEFLPLKKSGRSFKGLCPFHSEKTPSFTVNPERQIFHCFGCSEGGNVFSFVMKHQNLSFPEAVRYLADRWGLGLHHMLVAGDSGNDAEMLQTGATAVVVGNHSRELRGLRGKQGIYFADASYANGVLEGIEHFSFLGRAGQNHDKASS